MASKVIIFACLITITTAASVYHSHAHIPVVELSPEPSDNISTETSRYDSGNHIKKEPETSQSIQETSISNMSTEVNETLLRSFKKTIKNRRRPDPAFRRFRRPASSDDVIGDVHRVPASFQVRRDIKEITSVPPGELLTRKSLQNLASFIAGIVGVFFGPFGPVLSAVITPYISDILVVYALAGFVN